MCWCRQNLWLWWWHCWWQSLSPGKPFASHTHTCTFTAHGSVTTFQQCNSFLTNEQAANDTNLSQVQCFPAEFFHNLPHHIQQHQELGEPEHTSDSFVGNNQCFCCSIIKHTTHTAEPCRLGHCCNARRWWTVQQRYVDVVCLYHIIVFKSHSPHGHVIMRWTVDTKYV